MLRELIVAFQFPSLIRMSSERNQAASPFLRLPAEVRNNIYSLLVQSAIVDVHHTNWIFTMRRYVPGLILACRQTYCASKVYLDQYSILEFQGLWVCSNFKNTAVMFASHFRNVKILKLYSSQTSLVMLRTERDIREIEDALDRYMRDVISKHSPVLETVL